MKHLVVALPNTIHEHLVELKKRWDMQRLDDVVAELIRRDMEENR